MNQTTKLLLILCINCISYNQEDKKFAVFKNNLENQHIEYKKSENAALFNFIWDMRLILGHTILISEKLSTHRCDVLSKHQASVFEKMAQECITQLSRLKESFSLPEIVTPKIKDIGILEENVRKLERYEIVRLFSKLIVKLSKALPNRYRYRDHHARRLLNIVTATQEEMQNITESLCSENLNLEQFIQASDTFTTRMLSLNHLIK